MRCIFLVISLLLLLGCRKDNKQVFESSDFSAAYFPYKVGSELIYEVDSIIYDNFFDSIFESKTYRKYIIDSMDNSISTRTLFRVVVQESNDPNGKWQHKRVDQWALTSNYFETQINNIRFVHLSFPANFESVWNVNQFTNLSAEERYYIEINDTFKLENIIYQEVLKTENEPRKNQVVDIQNYEVFAKNIGWVYKKISNIEVQLNQKSGYSTESKLYDYKL